MCHIIPKEDGSKRKLIPKKEFKFTTAAKALGITRQTISKRFNNLISMGLIKIDDPEYYELITLPNDHAFLIEFETLGTLVSTLQEHCITTYIYLLNRYFANSEKPFEFCIPAIKQYLNISPTNPHNNFMVTESLNILNRLGLIKSEMYTKRLSTGEFITTYKLNYATNKLPTC